MRNGGDVAESVTALEGELEEVQPGAGAIRGGMGILLQLSLLMKARWRRSNQVLVQSDVRWKCLTKSLWSLREEVLHAPII